MYDFARVILLVALCVADRHKKVKYILDITIGYPDNIPLGMHNVMFNTLPPRTIKLLYRVYPIDDVPTDSTELLQWMNTMWAEKDEYLETFYKTGRFRAAPVEKPRQLMFSYGLFIAVHFFYIVSCCVLTLFILQVIPWLSIRMCDLFFILN